MAETVPGSGSRAPESPARHEGGFVTRTMTQQQPEKEGRGEISPKIVDNAWKIFDGIVTAPGLAAIGQNLVNP